MTQMTTLSADKIFQLGSAFWGSKTLLSAIELGLFTRLAASGPLPLPELRQTLGLHERGARDHLKGVFRSYRRNSVSSVRPCSALAAVPSRPRSCRMG